MTERTERERDRGPTRWRDWIGRLPKLVKLSLFTLSLSVTIALPVSMVSLVYAATDLGPGPQVFEGSPGSAGAPGRPGVDGSDGATGPQGGPGVSRRIVYSDEQPAVGVTSLQVSCRGGRKVMGGGGFLFDSNSRHLTDATLAASYPKGDAWLVIAFFRPRVNGDVDTLRVFAICAFAQ